MEEVVGSIPTRSTSLRFKSFGIEVLRFAQDFACGLGRPQDGSSSIPTRSTNSVFSDQLSVTSPFGLRTRPRFGWAV